MALPTYKADAAKIQAANNRIANKWNAAENRAMRLLAAGTPVGAVAEAVGITHPRICQLKADPDFAAALAEMMSSRLLATNELDAKYDQMEDELADRLKELIPMMYKPQEVLHALRSVNQMKRRGSAHAPEGAGAGQTVTLLMPTQIVNQYTQQNFTTNINNQVIRAGDQTLETVQSGTLLARTKQKLEGLHNEAPGTTHTSAISSSGGISDVSITQPELREYKLEEF